VFFIDKNFKIFTIEIMSEVSFQFVPYFEFKKDIERLKKKYPSIEKDLEKFKNNFAKEFKLNCDPLAGFERKLWKARIASSDMQRGKSGGFRLIFYFEGVKNPEKIYFLKIFPKVERGDISTDELMELFKNFMKWVYEGM